MGGRPGASSVCAGRAMGDRPPGWGQVDAGSQGAGTGGSAPSGLWERSPGWAGAVRFQGDLEFWGTPGTEHLDPPCPDGHLAGRWHCSGVRQRSTCFPQAPLASSPGKV